MGFVDNLFVYQQYDRLFTDWRDGLAGRQWREETLGSNPGRLFYSHLVSIPAHRQTATERAQFSHAFAAMVADADRDFPTRAPDEISLNGLRKTEALRRCDNGNHHLPRGAWREADLRGIELVPSMLYPLRLRPGRRPRVYRRLPVLAAIQPVFEGLFEALGQLGWNDLVYQSAGSGCFRGTKLRPGRFFRNPTPARLAELQAELPRNRRRAQRAMRAARRMSNHALGVAIDLNTFENDRTGGRPFGSLDPRVVALFEAFSFRWGACFPQPDPMHFQYCQAPCAPPQPGPTAPQSPSDDAGPGDELWDDDDDVYDSLDNIAPDSDCPDDWQPLDADEVDPGVRIAGHGESAVPPLPEEISLVGSTGGVSEQLSAALIEGCYLIDYIADFGRDSRRFNGTLRLERTGSGAIASGDIYSILDESADGSYSDFLTDRQAAAGIPVFPRDKYAAYLSVTKITDVGSPTEQSIRISVQIWPYDHSGKGWTKGATQTIELTQTRSPSGYPRGGAFLQGIVRDVSGVPIGRATIGWISSAYRRASVEIDRVPASDPLVSNQVGNTWRSIFAQVGWDVAAAESDANVNEPRGASWSTAELHAAMVSHRSNGADLDREWRYHLLCVRKIDITPRGVMYDAGASDSNNVPREGAAIASHWMVPIGPDPKAGGKSWGAIAGQRFGASGEPYFRAAVHELSHVMGLGHPHGSDPGNHIMVGTNGIVRNATPTTPFPANIDWRHSAEDAKRLRHLPDHWVRPGGHRVRFQAGAATYIGVPISPRDQAVEPENLRLSVTPVLTPVPIGAPVRIEIAVVNTGTTSVIVPEDFSLRAGTLSGRVVGPSGIPCSYRALIQCLDKPHRVSDLAPGAVLSQSETLLRGVDGALFGEDGWHQIVVDATWVADGVTFRATGKTDVLVTPPVDEAHDATAQRVLSTPDTLLVLALGGDHLTDGISAIGAALENPALRPHYAFIEAKRMARPFFDRAPDEEGGLALLDEATVLSAAEVRRASELAASCQDDAAVVPQARHAHPLEMGSVHSPIHRKGIFPELLYEDASEVVGDVSSAVFSPIDVNTKGDSVFTSLESSTEANWDAEEWADSEEELLEALAEIEALGDFNGGNEKGEFEELDEGDYYRNLGELDEEEFDSETEDAFADSPAGRDVNPRLVRRCREYRVKSVSGIYKAFEDEILGWMKTCVVSRTGNTRREIPLVRGNRSLKTVWENLEPGKPARIIPTYKWSDFRVEKISFSSPDVKVARSTKIKQPSVIKSQPDGLVRVPSVGVFPKPSTLATKQAYLPYQTAVPRIITKKNVGKTGWYEIEYLDGARRLRGWVISLGVAELAWPGKFTFLTPGSGFKNPFEELRKAVKGKPVENKVARSINFLNAVLLPDDKATLGDYVRDSFYHALVAAKGNFKEACLILTASIRAFKPDSGGAKFRWVQQVEQTSGLRKSIGFNYAQYADKLWHFYWNAYKRLDGTSAWTLDKLGIAYELKSRSSPIWSAITFKDLSIDATEDIVFNRGGIAFAEWLNKNHPQVTKAHAAAIRDRFLAVAKQSSDFNKLSEDGKASVIQRLMENQRVQTELKKRTHAEFAGAAKGIVGNVIKAIGKMK